jgi:hexosaminidase
MPISSSMQVEVTPQPKTLKFTGRWLEFDGFDNLPEFLSREFRIPRGRWSIDEVGGEGIGLNVEENRIEVWGDRNVYYATIIQLVKLKPGYLPEVSIEEEFNFSFRCFHLDIARGGVPKLEYFEKLLRLLFLLKYNYLAVYVEDLFPWKSYPEIGIDRGRLTYDEWSRIVSYGSQLGIDVFPSLEILGHMENILTLPSFRRFSEWHRPEEGCLDISNEEARVFAMTLLEDTLDQTKSNYIHVGGDETWALGRGRSLDVTGRFEGPKLYLEFYREVIDKVRRRGKIPILWGDMISGMYLRGRGASVWSELMESDLWRSVIVANWDYRPESKEYFKRKIKLFSERGLKQFVCPGLANWNRYYPDFDIALTNLKNFLDAAREEGVDGFMITAWGDDGEECLFSFIEPLILAAIEYGEGEGRWEDKWSALTGEHKSIVDARRSLGKMEIAEYVKPTLFQPRSKLKGKESIYEYWRSTLKTILGFNLPRDLDFLRRCVEVGLKKIDGYDSISDYIGLSSIYTDLWLGERKPNGLERVIGRFWSAASHRDLELRLRRRVED